MIRILYIITLYSFISLHSFAQKPKLKSISWLDNWKLEIKTGTVVLLTPVPEKYLELTNYVNVPTGEPGSLGTFSIKKSITSHIEMGYQFDYIRIKGKVNVSNTNVEVLTQSYIHTYQIQYNLKKTNKFKPLLNYYLYYKIGGISLKNDPLDPLPQGTAPVTSESKKKFASNVAVLTGIGVGINNQLSNNFSLTASFDLNRSSDAADEIYKVHKLFYHSSHTVNNYMELSIGLSYWFSFGSRKKNDFYNSRNETDKQLTLSRIEKKKGLSSVSNKSIWYESKKGK